MSNGNYDITGIGGLIRGFPEAGEEMSAKDRPRETPISQISMIAFRRDGVGLLVRWHVQLMDAHRFSLEGVSSDYSAAARDAQEAAEELTALSSTRNTLEKRYRETK